MTHKKDQQNGECGAGGNGNPDFSSAAHGVSGSSQGLDANSDGFAARSE